MVCVGTSLVPLLCRCFDPCCLLFLVLKDFSEDLNIPDMVELSELILCCCEGEVGGEGLTWSPLRTGRTASL